MAPSLASSQKPDEVNDDIVLSMEAPGTNPSTHTQIFDWVAPVARAVQNKKTHISFWQSISICSLDMISKHQVEHCCHFGCLPRQTRAWSIFMFFMVLTLFHRAGAKGLL
jgi:hypothetical protein